MMVLPMLLLMMSQRPNDHQIKLFILFALLMSTSAIKVSSLAVVPLIGIVSLGAQLLLEYGPRLLGQPLGGLERYRLRRAAGALSLVGLLAFIVMSNAGATRPPPLLALGLAAVSFGLFVLASTAEWREYMRPPAPAPAPCKEADERLAKLRARVLPVPSKHRGVSAGDG